jgi:diguanylate cyclase (GGDEF)-like protein
MSSMGPSKVFVLAQNAADAKRWTSFLSENAAGGSCVVDAHGEVEWDVLVTDFGRDSAAIRDLKDLLAEHGVITIAPAHWGEVCLGADFTPRELCLVTTLLGQIVRLRRQHRHALRLHDETRQLAETDPLTGLANRRAWERELAAHWAAAASGGESFWLAIVDLDRFKAVNDQQGYAAGDEVLRQVAAALAGQLRRGDTLARIGGDEFGLLLPAIDASAVGKVLDRLRAAVRDHTAAAGPAPITASIGSAASGEVPTPDALFQLAEQSLRQAKK